MKPKVAFFDFTSCEGCQLTVVDSLQTHVDLLDAVEIVQFREAMTEKGEDYAIAFVEGSISRASDEARLRRIREQAAIVVALGACAHLGGINAIRNAQPLDDVRKYVYGDKADWYETYPARPISAVVKVDAVIPGCPIDRDEFIGVVKALLLGKKPPLPDYPVCVECKRKENVCVFHKGGFCLGPVIRAGCGAICPTCGDGCEGCRGLIPNPNQDSMSDVLVKYGLTVADMLARWTMFGTYQQMEAGS
ncbi:MAG: NADH:ubiquinone oxidoreductase [Chloroflexi bacterium HGW-Chloroflexi-1]|nr:MAG: NADH:ubiquinone oxidoreductase [Chloroflexi bacterium HGW-Chloroflexi-1]